MNLKTFILIIAMKILAIQMIAGGIYCEIRGGATPGFLFITVGSLLFAIASNTTLFCVVYSRRRKKGGVNYHERDTDKIDFELAPNIADEHNADFKRAHRNIC